VKIVFYILLFQFQFIFSTQSYSFPISKSYNDVVLFLTEIQKKHPQNTQLFSIGVSDSGEEILGLKVGKGPTANLLVATHHGNEYGSTEVAKGFALEVAQNPIFDQTLYIIPVLNIAGFNTRSRNERDKNGRPYDPNRNYPGPCGGAGPFTLKSTKALSEFVQEKNIINSATLHTHFPAVVYPWGMSTKDTSTRHDEIFISLAKAATIWSNYRIGHSTDVIYAANGTFEDYAYWAYGVWSLLFELGHSHRPTQSEVDLLVSLNVPGILKMFEISPKERATDFAFEGSCNFSIQQRAY